MPLYGFRYMLARVGASAAFPDGQTVLRPQLPVVVAVASGRSVVCIATLDTGADRCVFPLLFAGRLGLNPQTMPSGVTHGATGKGTVYYADVSVSIPFRSERTGQVTTLQLQTRAGFTEGMDAQGIGLLGQIGFFDTYPVTFDQPGNLFSLHVSDTNT